MDEELPKVDILECLQDYHRILTNVVNNPANGARKRAVAHLRARQVSVLIAEVYDTETEMESELREMN